MLDLLEAAEGSGETQGGIIAGVELADGGEVVAPGGFGVTGVDGCAATHVADAQLGQGVGVVVGVGGWVYEWVGVDVVVGVGG